MNRKARIATAAGTAGVAAASLGALAANPAVRQAALRAGRFARPLGHDPARPPVPPPLPPGRVVNLPGRGEVFVRDSGGAAAGPAVLLLHGWTVSADLNFFPVYGDLAETYRVIAPDLRGHGRGMRSAEPFSLEDCADDVAALLGQVGVGRVIVVGYSMGGPVGMLLARRHPDLVRALVMQATALEWHGAVHERLTWQLLSVLELGLRLGTGADLVRTRSSPGYRGTARAGGPPAMARRRVPPRAIAGTRRRGARAEPLRRPAVGRRPWPARGRAHHHPRPACAAIQAAEAGRGAARADDRDRRGPRSSAGQRRRVRAPDQARRRCGRGHLCAAGLRPPAPEACPQRGRSHRLRSPAGKGPAGRRPRRWRQRPAAAARRRPSCSGRRWP